VRLVTRTINDLYFVLTVTSFQVSPALLAKGCCSASPPPRSPPRCPRSSRARRAAGRAAPLDAGAAPPRRVPWLAAAGALLFLAAARSRWRRGAASACLRRPVRADPGVSLLVPLLVLLLSRALLPLASRLFGNVGRLALRAIDAGLSRTGVAIAALCVAVAATVGVGIMVESFRDTVERWLGQTLRADLYVSAAGTVSSRTGGVLPAGVAERLRALPGVHGLSQGRSVQADSPAGPVLMLALELGPGSHRGFDLKGGAADDLWVRFAAGEVVLASEPYAWQPPRRHRRCRRSSYRRGAARIPHRRRVRDYGTDRGMLVIDRGAYGRFWRDPAVSTVGVFLDDPARLDDALTSVRDALADLDRPVLVRANRQIREQSLAIFDRTFAITGVLRLLAIGVAFIGVLSALLALQLERARDHAVLRALGVTPGQMVGLGALETAAWGSLPACSRCRSAGSWPSC